MNGKYNTEQKFRQQVLKLELDALEAADAPWEAIRPVKRAYFAALRQQALSLNQAPDQPIAMLREAVRAARAARIAGGRTMSENLEAAAAEEFAEKELELASCW